MEPNDVDYARDIFTDLVVAWTTKASKPPSSSEAAALAEKALEMARLFKLSQGQSGISTRSASNARPTDLDTPPLPGSGTTFAQVAREWTERVVNRSAGHSKRDLVSRFKRYVIPHLGDRPVGEVEPQEILSVLRSIEGAGYSAMAYQTFKDLRFMYRYAIVAGLSKQDPTSALRRAINKPKRRGTAMLIDPDSIGRLLLAMRRYQGKPRSTARFMLRLAPIVFLRPSELRTLEWKDVDLDAATVAIPACRMKSGRPHVVPLARQAVQLLRDVHKITGYGRFVFTAGRGLDQSLHFSIFHFMLGAMGYRNVVTPHGFRVLASTWLNEQGWRPELIERQLSHLGSDRTGRLYNRAEYLSERRKMMQVWADYLESLEHKAKASLRGKPVTGPETKSKRGIHAAV